MSHAAAWRDSVARDGLRLVAQAYDRQSKHGMLPVVLDFTLPTYHRSSPSRMHRGSSGPQSIFAKIQPVSWLSLLGLPTFRDQENPLLAPHRRAGRSSLTLCFLSTEIGIIEDDYSSGAGSYNSEATTRLNRNSPLGRPGRVKTHHPPQTPAVSLTDAVAFS